MANLTAKIEQRRDAGAESPVRRHENRVLASLPQADLAYLARNLHVVSLRPGAVLQDQDQPLDFIYFPHESLVSLLAVTPAGQIMEAASVGRAGAVCPVDEAWLGKGFLTARAQGAMRVSRLAVTQFEIALKEIAAFRRTLRGCQQELMLQLRQNIVCGGLHTLEQRLSRWLLETADRLETDRMPILITQEQVAQRLGVRRTTVTLITNKLQDSGAISWGRSRVEIIDRSKLVSTACSCYAALSERILRLLPSEAP